MVLQGCDRVTVSSDGGGPEPIKRNDIKLEMLDVLEEGTGNIAVDYRVTNTLGDSFSERITVSIKTSVDGQEEQDWVEALDPQEVEEFRERVIDVGPGTYEVCGDFEVLHREDPTA